MDVKVWNKRFYYENSILNWNCPRCNSKSLEILKDELIIKETQDSLEMQAKTDYWETEWSILNVSGQIQCRSCQESLMFIGKGSYEENQYFDHEIEDCVTDYNLLITFLFIHPIVNIFNIPSSCPSLVRDKIVESFTVYWSDLESCANKIRISLEYLMDAFKVKKTLITKKGTRDSITLHKRIELFPNKEVRELLLAIKWIGNVGSHSKTKLEILDILETYKVYENVLEKLYANEGKLIYRIAQQINKRKRVRKRT